MTDAKKGKLGQTEVTFISFTQDSAGFRIARFIGLKDFEMVDSGGWGLATRYLCSKRAVFSPRLCLIEVAGARGGA